MHNSSAEEIGIYKIFKYSQKIALHRKHLRVNIIAIKQVKISIDSCISNLIKFQRRMVDEDGVEHAEIFGSENFHFEQLEAEF